MSWCDIHLAGGAGPSAQEFTAFMQAHNNYASLHMHAFLGWYHLLALHALKSAALARLMVHEEGPEGNAVAVTSHFKRPRKLL